MTWIRVSLEDLRKMDKRYERMFEMLKRLEWVGMVTLQHCPSCFRWRYKGHKDTCVLNNILNEVFDADLTGTLKRNC